MQAMGVYGIRDFDALKQSIGESLSKSRYSDVRRRPPKRQTPRAAVEAYKIDVEEGGADTKDQEISYLLSRQTENQASAFKKSQNAENQRRVAAVFTNAGLKAAIRSRRLRI